VEIKRRKLFTKKHDPGLFYHKESEIWMRVDEGGEVVPGSILRDHQKYLITILYQLLLPFLHSFKRKKVCITTFSSSQLYSK
jgi:hypothetical protein